MVIEILGAIAADAAGESMQKNKEKKKLEATKDNPERTCKSIGRNRKKKGKKQQGCCFLVGLIFAYSVFSVKSSPRHVIHRLDYVSMAKNNREKI